MRSRTLACLSLFLLLVFFAAVQIATAQIPCSPTVTELPTLFVNWPQYHFDAAHSGCNPYESLLGVDTVGNLVVKWKFTTTGMISEPVIVNGVAYVGSVAEHLWAVNVNTGKTLWQFPIEGVISGAIVANGMVYAGVSFGLGRGALYALDASTGTFVWSYNTAEVLSETELAAASGVVYVGSSGGDLEALNAKTGAFLWKSTYTTRPLPAVVGDVVYVSADKVYALDADTGNPIWSYSNGLDNPTTPAVVNGVVYVGLGVNYVVALNAKSGALVWKSNLNGFTNRDMAVANGVVYLVVSSLPFGEPSYMTALNASTGDVLWQYEIANGLNPPIVANGVVYVGASDENVYALNARTGTTLAKYGVGPSGAAPAVANGVLYVSAGESLYAFSLPGH